MARQTLNAQIPAAGGLTPVWADGHADGFKFDNDGHVVLLVNNTDADDACVVTIVTPGTVDGQAVADRVVTVPAASQRWIGQLNPRAYNRADTEATDPNKVYVNLAPAGTALVTDTKVALVRG